jgi:hypothetical protein
MKYLVALALALGVVALAGIDAQAAVRCGPERLLSLLSAPLAVAVGGAHHTAWHNSAPYGCADVQRGLGLCH